MAPRFRPIIANRPLTFAALHDPSGPARAAHGLVGARCRSADQACRHLQKRANALATTRGFTAKPRRRQPLCRRDRKRRHGAAAFRRRYAGPAPRSPRLNLPPTIASATAPRATLAPKRWRMFTQATRCCRADQRDSQSAARRRGHRAGDHRRSARLRAGGLSHAGARRHRGRLRRGDRAACGRAAGDRNVSLDRQLAHGVYHRGSSSAASRWMTTSKTRFAVLSSAFRMAGHDLEVDGPRRVSLEIDMHVCAEPDYFRADVKRELLELFSNREFADGRLRRVSPRSIHLRTNGLFEPTDRRGAGRAGRDVGAGRNNFNARASPTTSARGGQARSRAGWKSRAATTIPISRAWRVSISRRRWQMSTRPDIAACPTQCGCCAGVDPKHSRRACSTGPACRRLAYRIGTHCSFKQRCLAALSRAEFPALQRAAQPRRRRFHHRVARRRRDHGRRADFLSRAHG